MKTVMVLCTVLVCWTLLSIGKLLDDRWHDEGDKWRALERTKYILDHQLPKPDKPSIEVPKEQDA